jgi:hypothetical protein
MKYHTKRDHQCSLSGVKRSRATHFPPHQRVLANASKFMVVLKGRDVL